MTVVDKYPFLKMTLLTMAYSTGVINRACDERTYAASLDPILGADGVDHEVLQSMNDFLGTLNEDEVLTVADGDVEESAKILARFSDGDRLNGFLNDCFEHGG